MNGTTTVVGWDLTVPADTEVVGLGDDRMRSIKSSAQAALNDEHNFPSSDGTGFGYHRKGSARPYYDTTSRISSDGTDGRLMLTSDASTLYGLTAADKIFLGGPNVISAYTAPSTFPQRFQWIESFGTGITGAAGNVRITYPGSGFSGIPILSVTAGSNGTTPQFLSIMESKTTNFVVVGYDCSGGTVPQLAIMLFHWRSTGTVAI